MNKITCSCDWGHDIKFQGIPSLTPPLRFIHFPSMRNPALWPTYIIDKATFHRLVWYSSSSEDSNSGCVRYYQVIQLITPRILVQAFNRCNTVGDPMKWTFPHCPTLLIWWSFSIVQLGDQTIWWNTEALRSFVIFFWTFCIPWVRDSWANKTRIAHNHRVFFNYHFLW